MVTAKGKLYLIPTLLGPSAPDRALPAFNAQIILRLNEFIVEEERTARRFLRSIGYTRSFDEVTLHLLNEHTRNDDTSAYLKSVKEGRDIGLLSEAGVPCIADPGSSIVRLAHLAGITVVPLVGPSSLLLALMASGMNGQHFTFHGYLPAKTDERARKLKLIEKEAYSHHATQLFIETPYRNMALLEAVLQQCMPATLLCIACDITLDSEFIVTRTVAEWKKSLPVLGKRPAVFLLAEGY
jgi:16S rRNA (cytidine1402-2'-O)-methyltransferase